MEVFTNPDSFYMCDKHNQIEITFEELIDTSEVSGSVSLMMRLSYSSAKELEDMLHKVLSNE
jgi:hypothetical protein